VTISIRPKPPPRPVTDFFRDAGVNDLASPFDVTRQTNVDRYYRIHVIPPNATVYGSFIYVEMTYMRRAHDGRQSAIAGTQQGLKRLRENLPIAK
jgi:hypothetical protein